MGVTCRMVVRVVMRAQLIVERTFAVLESMHDVMFEEKCKNAEDARSSCSAILISDSNCDA